MDNPLINFEALSEEQKYFTVPYGHAFNWLLDVSYQIEAIFEKGIRDTQKVYPSYDGDYRTLTLLSADETRMHETLNLIDTFHCNLPGAQYIFARTAMQLCKNGMKPALVEALPNFEFDDDMPTFIPTIRGFVMNSDGVFERLGENFDRNDALSMAANFERVLTEGSGDQKDRFKQVFKEFERLTDGDVAVNWFNQNTIRILQSLEKAETKRGRRKGQITTPRLSVDTLQVMVCKTLYILKNLRGDEGQTINKTVNEVIEQFDVLEKSRDAAHRRLTRHLKTKLEVRGLLDI